MKLGDFLEWLLNFGCIGKIKFIHLWVDGNFIFKSYLEDLSYHYNSFDFCNLFISSLFLNNGELFIKVD